MTDDKIELDDEEFELFFHVYKDEDFGLNSDIV